jgi:hypothetical protein
VMHNAPRPSSTHCRIPDFEGIRLFWEHDLSDFDRLAAPKAQKA